MQGSVGAVAGTISPGAVRIETVTSVLGAMDKETAPSPITDWIIQACGPYLDDGRNRIVLNYLALDPAEHPDVLLFIDSDIMFTASDVHAVVSECSPDTPVVGGAYCSPQGGRYYVVAYDYVDGEPGSVFEGMRTFRSIPVDDVRDEKGLREVDGLGTGFMAIHRSLLHEMEGRWEAPQQFFAENVVGGVHLGEDLCFCLRVKHMGYPVILHQGAKVTHFKTVGLNFQSVTKPETF